MSFQIGGITWTPETASQHAFDLLNSYNALLSAQGLPPVAPTQSNALWLLMLAVGAKEQAQDEVLVQAINSYSLDMADAQQIQNLLPVAGTELGIGQPSAVILAVTSLPTLGATVPSGTPAQYAGLTFTTVSGLSVPPSGTGFIEALCTVDGPNAVPANAINAFGVSVPGVLSVTNPNPAIIGTLPETPNEARIRLQVGDVVAWQIDGLQRTLENIFGVGQCRIWFNYSTVSDMVLTGGLHIAPRTMLIVITGSDPTGTAIANAYAQLVNVPTSGTLSQPYTYQSGQTIEVSYMPASGQNFYVKMLYDSATTPASGFQSILTNDIESLGWIIGQTITAADILAGVQPFPYAKLVDAQISFDNSSWTNKLVFDGAAIPTVAGVTVVSG